ncbi:MAG: rhamnulokinase [Terriglobales bacterium]
MKRPALVAVDLGAESCRISLLRWRNDGPQINLVHRFRNGPVQQGDSLRWDIGRICRGVEKGLRLCADLADEGIDAVAVDGWAVDYVRLDRDGQALEDPFCYRDERTIAAESAVSSLISRERLYELTGIQLMRLNTVYQLYADKLAEKNSAATWLNLPEFVSHYLGGAQVAEYTNATHTQLVRLGTHEWSGELFDALGLDLSAAPSIVPTGSLLGRLSGPLASLPAFRNTRLLAPACHDTASAIAGIPAQGDDWAFISSGTWSLVGTVLDKPCATPDAMRENFTNLGGAGGQTCFLKNVNGMWLLQRCLDHWQSNGQPAWTAAELIEESGKLPAPGVLLDVDDPDLLLPGDMPARINEQLRRRDCSPLPSGPAAAPSYANLIFHSLAERYAQVLRRAASVSGKKFSRVYIMGGGSRNRVLNRLTSERAGLPVELGSAESATIGNFAVQLAALECGTWSSPGVPAKAIVHWATALASAPFIATNRTED